MGLQSVQARIDADLKHKFSVKCVELRISQADVLTKAVEAFVEYGVWWEDEPEDDMA